MTPQKIKARELVHKYRMLFMNEGEDFGEEILVSILSKQCALIAVDEMLQLGGLVGSNLSDNFYIYWQEVKTEIEKL